MPFFVLPPHPYFIYLLLINYIILYIVYILSFVTCVKFCLSKNRLVNY
ncbi:hypothetical protein 2204_scaffold211_00021 [Bacteriophage sp.]|nr:hypothetical protein 2204_scaffold211_00021 [Bacteriophage sp.]UYE98157.1 MAG: hypothetical protein [Bacteroides phage NR01]